MYPGGGHTNEVAYKRPTIEINERPDPARMTHEFRRVAVGTKKDQGVSLVSSVS